MRIWRKACQRIGFLLPRVLLLSLWATAAGQTSSSPRYAVIVDPDTISAWPMGPMGNVKVTFFDGHSELWTREGHAMLPHVSGKGLVGWTVATADNNLGMHLNNLLRVCWPDGHHHDFTVDMPFIEKWAFSRKSTAVVLEFRGTHGPENYAEYDLVSGARLEEADGVMNDVVPSWADVLSD